MQNPWETRLGKQAAVAEVSLMITVVHLQDRSRMTIMGVQGKDKKRVRTLPRHPAMLDIYRHRQSPPDKAAARFLGSSKHLAAQIVSTRFEQDF
jgi:hypothetical protein